VALEDLEGLGEAEVLLRLLQEGLWEESGGGGGCANEGGEEEEEEAFEAEGDEEQRGPQRVGIFCDKRASPLNPFSVQEKELYLSKSPPETTMISKLSGSVSN
jgi:hypothetical protein